MFQVWRALAPINICRVYRYEYNHTCRWQLSHEGTASDDHDVVLVLDTSDPGGSTATSIHNTLNNMLRLRLFLLLLPTIGGCSALSSTSTTKPEQSFSTHILDFPNYAYQTQLTSEPFAVQGPDGIEHRFRVHVYPRGYRTQHKKPTGFGMSYQLTTLFDRPPEDKVAVYLQSLSPHTLDASFALRLLGQQSEGPRFDVEWRAGMRFVPLEEPASLQEGKANDFGAHLMQTHLLHDFCGGDGPLRVQVQVLVHETPAEEESTNANPLLPRELRPHHVRVGSIVVPVLHSLHERPRLFQLGAYPGVEYRVLRILDPDNNHDVFFHQEGCDYELKPLYPLVPQLERAWPVRVNEKEIPRLLSPTMYNALSAVGSLATALTGLFTAFCISQAISLFVIPSLSMDPTLQKGDVILVDKVTPLVWKHYERGDVVFFRPPPALQQIVGENVLMTDRDLFVKRIAGLPGDVLDVDPTGAAKVNGASRPPDLCQEEPLRLIEQYVRGDQRVAVGPKEVVVLGDCSSVSIDSRVWGPLSQDSIVGRPIVRLLPLSRMGPISDSWSVSDR